MERGLVSSERDGRPSRHCRKEDTTGQLNFTAVPLTLTISMPLFDPSTS